MKNKSLVIVACIVFVLVVIVGISVSPSNAIKIDKKESIIKNELVEEVMDVKLVNLSEGEVVEGAEVVQNPVVDNMEIKDAILTFSNPGDYVVYNFDIVNSGNVNTELSSIEIPSITCTSLNGNQDIANKVCDNIGIDLGYRSAPNKIVEFGDSLAANTKVGYVMTIIYNNGENVPENVKVKVENIKMKIGYKKNKNAKITVGQIN